jgi:AbrB family looped-hinge helix DNA binding protein
MPSVEASRVGKRGAVVIPARLRRRFGIEEGDFVIAEEREEGILIRRAEVRPVAAYLNNEMYQISLNTDRLVVYGNGTYTTQTIPDTQFHDYRLTGIPGQRFEVYMDGVLLDSVVPSSYNLGYNELYFGDGTSYGNCSAELTSYTFTQGPDIKMLSANLATCPCFHGGGLGNDPE